jgi:hypothetical protein
MLKLTLRDGETFEGETALDLVEAMKGATMFSDAKCVLDYIAAVQARIARTEKVELAVEGKQIDARCEAFLQELDRAGLAELQRTSGEDLDHTVKMIRLVAEQLNAGDLTGAWAFLRPRLRLTEDEVEQIERRLGPDLKAAAEVNDGQD